MIPPTECVRCGCAAQVHDHYRLGSDCGACGPVVCRRYLDPFSVMGRAVLVGRVLRDASYAAGLALGVLTRHGKGR